MKEFIDSVFNEFYVLYSGYDVVLMEYSLKTIRQQFIRKKYEIGIVVSFRQVSVSGDYNEQAIIRINIPVKKILIDDKIGKMAMYNYEMFHLSYFRCLTNSIAF